LIAKLNWSRKKKISSVIDDWDARITTTAVFFSDGQKHFERLASSLLLIYRCVVQIARGELL
jgi:hypothetical protein